MANEVRTGDVTESEAARSMRAGPCSMVIFGAAGDLTKRLVVPALYNLGTGKLLPKNFALIGIDVAELTTDSWRATSTEKMQSFTKGGGEFHIDADRHGRVELADRAHDVSARRLRGRRHFHEAGRVAAQVERDHQSGGNVLFYLAVADRFFGPLAEKIGEAGLADQQEGKRWRRVIVEKPFGHDLASAQGAQRAAAEGPGRRPDLSDRPFSRKGDGPEHHGSPFRQRSVRADLEP